MPDPPDRPPTPGWPWSEGPGNPRTYPSRGAAAVEAEVRRSAHQHDELLTTMAATGQTGALVIAPLELVPVAPGRACTATTWSQGPVTVLPHADVVILFELPGALDAEPVTTRVRWDVVARVCGPTCWRPVAGLEPRRVITRDWPADSLLEVIRALSLPDLP